MNAEEVKSKQPKIKVDRVSKIFGRDPKRGIKMLEQGIPKEEIMKKTRLAVGVNNASFEVAEREMLLVMGLSGSGKSTLLRCLNRLIEPTAGHVYMDGIDVTALSDAELRRLRQKKFGMVFQRFALLPHRTVQQNTEFGLEIQGMDAAQRAEKARSSLKLVGLEGWEDSYPEQLSGGM
jgi:glycine betaine/proline transport system ATP-binding protein